MSDKYLIQKETLDNIASQSMNLAGKTEAVTTSEIISDLTEVNTEISLQSNLISEISAALDGKVGGSGGSVNPNIMCAYLYDYEGTGFYTSFWFEEGMTWLDYMNSKYSLISKSQGNTEPLFSESSGYVVLSGNYVSADKLGENVVSVSAAIIENKLYYTTM